MPDAASQFADLATLLRRRVDIIADHAWRDRDGESHLAALAAVSGEIAEWEAGQAGPLPPRLRHFLQNCSYQKALEWVMAGETGE